MDHSQGQLQYPQHQNFIWNTLFLKQELLQAIAALGYQQPSQIQARGIPKILQGKNVICQSKAGMGKTAVFVLGILNKMQVEGNNEYRPHQCVVVAHTRELAYQIKQEFIKFSKYLCHPSIRVGCFIGGLPIDRDLHELANKTGSPHIIIGTPGRLLDLLYRGYINAATVRYFVVDECDVVLADGSRGMVKEIMQIHKNLGKEVQHIMVSATFTPRIIQICNELCDELVEVFVDDGLLDLSGLVQFFEVLPEQGKLALLEQILDTTPFSQAIVFTNSIEKTAEVARYLTSILFNPICIHSELTQEERIDNYNRFKGNGSRVLVATDLFGRGIDIEKVNLVVNLDFPRDLQHYVHRVGRAGRFNTRGIVITFVEEKYKIGDLTQLKAISQKIRSLIGRLPANLELGQFFQN